MYPEEMKLDQLTKSFVKHNLSAAGVSYIFKSKSSIRRWAWFVMVAICMIFMAYMTANVILEYLSFPKMNIKEDVILPHLPFPAVTLCPLNPITARNVSPSLKRFTKLSRMLKNAIVKKRNKPLRNKCHKDPLCQWSWFKETCNCIKNPCLSEYCLAENSTHCGCSNIFCGAKKHQSCREVPLLSRNGRSCVCVGESAINQAITKHNQVDPKTQDLLESVDDKEVREVISLIKDSRSFDLIDVEEAFMPSTEELYNYSIPFNGFVSSCSFEGRSCYQENFTVLFHPNYGVCYMFNFVGNEQPGSEVPVNTYSYGSGSGLQLLLRVDDRFVLDLLRREIGARIVIHDPHSLPFVSEYGINIRPHDMTVIELSLSKTEKLDKPWGDCKRERYLHSNDGPYSVLGCEKGCAMKHMTSLCNCTMRYLLRGTVLSSRPPPFPLCNMSHDAHRDCLYKSINDISSSSKACKCKPPCSETKYRISVAASELNENYFRTVKAVHTLQLDEEGNLTYVNNTDSKAMLGVKIYYNTFMVTIDKEIASYSWQTLISNIGGNLGFFMGLTLVTFFEITEFLWDVMRVAFARFATPKVDDFRGPKTPSSKSRAAQRTMKRLYYRNQLKKNVLQRKKQWL